MTTVNTETMRMVEGGTTYACPWCGYQGNYLLVYGHVLYKGCFKKNPYLKALWRAGWGLIGIGNKLPAFLKLIK